MKVIKLFLICGLVITAGISAQSWAKDEPKAKAAEKKPAKEEDKEAKPKFRMPNYYTQLDLDEKQKESIKKIYEDMTPKIDKIRKELQVLEGERDEKYHKVLTKDQLSKFYELKGGKAKEKAEDTKEKTTKKAA
jgi:hypothetical protein